MRMIKKAVRSAVASPPSFKPRTPMQVAYVEMLKQRTPPIVVAHGPAGCGKTLLSTLVGIEELEAGRVEKLVMTRPAVSSDEAHGFLPGTLEEKMSPWVRPIMDVLRSRFGDHQIKQMCAQGMIELAPLAYMRGRTFNNAWIVCDEAQNCTPNQVMMVLTRIGENSKVVVTGDLDQYDRNFQYNGLADLINRISNDASVTGEQVGIIRFDVHDVQRHPIIPTVLSLYQQNLS